jgi:hypothetical protein
MAPQTDVIQGDCKDVLRQVPDDSVDLIVTSPPYADQRKDIYGGIHTDNWTFAKSITFYIQRSYMQFFVFFETIIGKFFLLLICKTLEFSALIFCTNIIKVTKTCQKSDIFIC